MMAILHEILETTTSLNMGPPCWLRQRSGGGGGPHFRKANIGRLETETRAENLSGFPLYGSVPEPFTVAGVPPEVGKRCQHDDAGFSGSERYGL